MARVKRGVTAHAKHKKVLKAAKGYLRPPQEHHPHRQGGGRQGDAIRLSRPQEPQARVPRPVDPAHQRGGARARPHLFSRFIAGLIAAGVEVDRKVLSDLAISEPAAFAAIVEKAKGHLPKAA